MIPYEREPEADDGDDDQASDTDWMTAAESIASDLDNFEAFLWPVYRDRGFPRDAAVVCFYLHLNVVEKRRGSGE